MPFSSEKVWINSIILYVYFISTWISSEHVNEKPKLTLDHDWPESDWKFVNLSDGSQALFSKEKSTFILNCSASYPIQWIIQGTIEPPEFVKIQPYRRISSDDGTSEIFFLQIIVFFTSFEPSFSSATISCEKIGAPKVASKYSVFVPNNNTLLLSTKVTSKFMIPCPTTDPTVTVTLYRVQDGNLIKVEGEYLTYIEIEGFKSSIALEGTFACVAKHNNGTKESRVIFIVPTALTMYMKGFIGNDGSVNVYCSSPNYTVYTNDTTLVQNIKVVETNFQEHKIMIPNKTPVKGTLNCINFESGNITKIWNFEIIGTSPELHLNNYEGEVDCLSEYPDRSVSTVRCRDPSDCEYMKHCLEDHQSCNYRKQKQFHSQFPARCWVQEKNEGAFCASLPFYHLNGIVECGGGGGAVKHFMFFVGLDFHRYSCWKEAPKNALIRLGYEKFENQTEFTCESVSFLFADSLKFSIKYDNGTEVFLKLEDGHDKSSLYAHPKRMDEFNVVGAFTKTEPFPPQVISLTCHAPWWNSTEWMTSEITLRTGNLMVDNCL